MSDDKRSVVVFYDDPCLDGAVSAWVLRRALYDTTATNVPLSTTYVPIGYGRPEDRTRLILSHLHDGAEALFVDTSPKDDTLDILFFPKDGHPKISKLTVIDHHHSEVTRLKSFEKNLGKAPSDSCQPSSLDFKFILDPSKPSAAVIAWELYNPNQAPPALLEWIGRMEPPVTLKTDRDYAIAAYIDSKSLAPSDVFKTIDELTTLSEDEMVTRGNSILADQLNNISKGIKSSFTYAKLELLPGKHEWIPIVSANVQNFGRRINEALNEVANAGATCGVAGAWFVSGDATVKLSLRSRGTPNVGEIAKYLGSTVGVGGGGHATDAVVQFRDLEQFSQAVRPKSREAMLAERWKRPTLPPWTNASPNSFRFRKSLLPIVHLERGDEGALPQATNEIWPVFLAQIYWPFRS